MPAPLRSISLAVLASAVLLVVRGPAMAQGSGPAMLAFTDFVAEVGRGRIADVTLNGPVLLGHYHDGRIFETGSPLTVSDSAKLILDRGPQTRIWVGEDMPVPSAANILLSWLPLLMMAVVWLLIAWYPTRTIARRLDALRQSVDRLGARSF